MVIRILVYGILLFLLGMVGLMLFAWFWVS